MRYSDYSPHLLGILRIVCAGLFLVHGTEKLFGFPAGEAINANQVFSFKGLAGIIEFFGGMCILIGYSTRPVAFLLSGEMAVAYFKAHAPVSTWPLLNGGELAMLYCFLFLFISSAGAGKFSIDGSRGYD